MLHMHRMADPVAWAAVPDTESFASTLKKQVIVGVLEIGLDQVVVHVLNRDLRPGTSQPHRFQFEHHQGASSILRQSLIDANPDHFTGNHLSFDEMAFD